MTKLILVLNEFASAWWAWTVTSTAQGLLLLAVVALVLWGWKSMRPGLRYGLLLVVLVKLAVPPVIGASYGFSDLLARAFAEAPSPPPVMRPVQVTSPPPAARVSEAPVVMVPSAPMRPKLSPIAWLLLLEVAGALAVFALVVRQLRATKSALRSAERGDETITERLRRVAGEMGVRRVPCLYISAEFNAPQSGGVLRPFILLPDWALSLAGEDLDILLAHELAHIRRWDALVNSLQAAAQALLWWNPAVWWLNRRIREAREFCCDDLVLSRGIATGATYSRALVNVAERVSAPAPAWALAGMADNFGAIDRRVRRALEGAPARSGWRRYGAVAALLLVASWVLPGATDGAEQRDDISVGTTVTLRVAGGVDIKILGERTEHRHKPDGWFGAVLEGDVKIEIEGIAITARRVEFNEDLSAITFHNAALQSGDFGTVQAEQIRVDPVARQLDILNGTLDEVRLKAAFGENAKNAARGEWLTLPFTVAEQIGVEAIIVDVDRDLDVEFPFGSVRFMLPMGAIADVKPKYWDEFKTVIDQLVKSGDANMVGAPNIVTLDGEIGGIETTNVVTLQRDGEKIEHNIGFTLEVTPTIRRHENGDKFIEVLTNYAHRLLTKEGEVIAPEPLNAKFTVDPVDGGSWSLQFLERDDGRVDIVMVRFKLIAAGEVQ